MKIVKAGIQDYYTQTGVGNNLCFFWKYDYGTHVQKAYRIDIYKDNEQVYSTGKIVSAEQNNIYLSLTLQEQTVYEYRIFVWDEAEQMECSDKYSFVTGVKDWKGFWIGNDTKKPMIVRKSFIYDGKGEAVLSLCATGQFEVLVNGKKISSAVYEGAQTDYHHHICYNTYRITERLAVGENEITIETANGWYLGDNDDGKRYFYTIGMGYVPFGECLLTMAQLKIADRYIVTDDSWKVSRSKTVLADIYGSEDMDYTISYEWKTAQILQDKAPKGAVVPFTYPPIIHKYCYEPQHIDQERMIFDFGQNMSSQFALKIRGERGQKVRVIPAEKLKTDGDIEQTVDTYSILILSGEEDIFEQKFSVNGARWYKIEGASFEQILEFKSFFATSSAEDTGKFQCSDENYNKIYSLILKAIESNLNHLHTDCPTIEKLGWLEPNHLMAHAVMYNKNVDTLWSKIAMDMRDSQYKESEFDMDVSDFKHEYKDGLIPSIAPRYARFTRDCGEGSFWDIIPWGSSIVLAAYEQYKFYNNRMILEENYESAKKYVEYLTKQYSDYNRLYHKNGEERFICCGLGDWGIEQNKGCSRENLETAFYYHDLRTMAEISQILEKHDENEYIRQAEQVRKNYNRALLVREEDRAYYRSYDNGGILQANQAVPLCFGLVPEDCIELVESELVSLCTDSHLKCGEIGLVYILRALSAMGEHEKIHEMIMKEEHPSYLRFVKQNETTLPEFWRDDARSRNHDMMGHIMEWFFTEVAGVKSEDGFRTVQIAPKCQKFINEFICEFDSIRGKISVHYKDGALIIQTANNISLCVD